MILFLKRFLLQTDIFKPSVAPNLLEQVFIRRVCVRVLFIFFKKGIMFLKFIEDTRHINHCKYYCKFNCIFFWYFFFLELLCVCLIDENCLNLHDSLWNPEKKTCCGNKRILLCGTCDDASFLVSVNHVHTRVFRACSWHVCERVSFFSFLFCFVFFCIQYCWYLCTLAAVRRKLYFSELQSFVCLKKKKEEKKGEQNEKFLWKC